MLSNASLHRLSNVGIGRRSAICSRARLNPNLTDVLLLTNKDVTPQFLDHDFTVESFYFSLFITLIRR